MEQHLAIFHIHPQLYWLRSPQEFYIFSTQTEKKEFERRVDETLGIGKCKGTIPVATKVELFVRRADRDGPGVGGNDFVFVNSWGPAKDREQAILEKYCPGDHETFRL